MIKARPTSRELNSCRDQHSCRTDPRADLRSLHSGQPDTRVDTRPRSSLSVGLVYVSLIMHYQDTYGGTWQVCITCWHYQDTYGGTWQVCITCWHYQDGYGGTWQARITCCALPGHNGHRYGTGIYTMKHLTFKYFNTYLHANLSVVANCKVVTFTNFIEISVTISISISFLLCSICQGYSDFLSQRIGVLHLTFTQLNCTFYSYVCID